MWISVDDRLPAERELKRYKVIMRVGSFNVKILETFVLGRLYEGQGNTFRFMVGDWQEVTHWMPTEDETPL